MQLPEQGRHNSVEPGAAGKAGGGTIRDHAIVHAEDLDRSRQTGKCAAQQQGQHNIALDLDACIARGMRILSHGADAITQRRAPQQDVNQDRQHDRDQRAQMQTGRDQAGQAENFQQAGRLRDLGCQLRLRGIDHRSAQQEVHQLHGDGIHHHRAQDFIDVEISFEIPRNSAPDRPTQKSCQHGKRDHQPARQTGEGQTHPGRQERADDHLPFPADVDHIAAEGDADADRNQQQRRGFDQCLCKGIGAAEGALPQCLVGLDRD